MELNEFLKKEKFVKVMISFNNEKWHHDIPSKSGWYFIETDTPIDKLAIVGDPVEPRNYNIPEKVKSNKYLLDKGFAINQNNKDLYIVYSGHAQNLKARAREHSFGGNGTGCLAISKYNVLKKFHWTFCYLRFEEFDIKCGDDKNARIYGEQIFRAEYGFPILCSE